jgi:hypothetical protein
MGRREGSLEPRHDGWHRQKHSTQRPCGCTWFGRGNPCYISECYRHYQEAIPPLPSPAVHDCVDIGAAAAPPTQPAGRVPDVNTCKGVPECATLLSSGRRAHTRHGLPKERRPGAYACAVVEKSASQRLLSSYVCVPLPLTCRPFVYSVLLSVCSKRHTQLSIETLPLSTPISHTSDCLTHISHHHHISIITITTSRPACTPTTYL